MTGEKETFLLFMNAVLSSAREDPHGRKEIHLLSPWSRRHSSKEHRALTETVMQLKIAP
jgi:hypothetical protein